MATAKNGGTKGKAAATNAPAPEVINQTLDTVQNGGTPAPAPEEGAPAIREGKKDNRFTQISMPVYVKALTDALMNRKAAIRLEMAVGLSVFIRYGSVDNVSKIQLQRVYQEAGYQTATSKDADYKTVRRRIDAAAGLFDFIGPDEIAEVTANNDEDAEIRALVRYLEDNYDFYTINGVLEKIGKPVAQTNTPERRSTRAGGAQGDALPQGTAGEGGVNEQGQVLTKDGTVDKRVKTEDDTSIATKQARGEMSKEEGDAAAGKQPEGQQQPTAEDKGVMARVSEFLNKGEQPAKQQRRATDSPHVVLLTTENMMLAIPHGTKLAEIKEMMFKLMQVANELQSDDDAVTDKIKGDPLPRSAARTH